MFIRNDRIGRALAAIDGGHLLSSSVGEIAASVGLSEFHFSRIFRSEVGLSVSAYVRRRRLRLAARRLRWTPMPIRDIADEANYASQAVFTRAFTVQFGIPPLQYRRTEAARPGTSIGEGQWAVNVRSHPAVGCLQKSYHLPNASKADIWADFLDSLDIMPADVDPCALVGIVHDVLDVDPDRPSRYDCALLDPYGIHAAELSPEAMRNGVRQGVVDGGQYAALDYGGDYIGLIGTLSLVSKEWLPTQHRYQFSHRPLREFVETSDSSGGAWRVRQVLPPLSRSFR